MRRTFLEDDTAVRSELEGMWYPGVGLNDTVPKGQVVGQIRNFFGEPLADVQVAGREDARSRATPRERRASARVVLQPRFSF